jgi:hypothetical protein
MDERETREITLKSLGWRTRAGPNLGEKLWLVIW